MAYVYILKSIKSAKTYVGSTINLDKRVWQHNNGKSTFTKRFMPWKLVYKEEIADISEARARERYFKSAAGRRFIKKLDI